MTSLFLYNTTNNGLGFRDLDFSQGDGVQSDVTNTANGPQDILIATWITPTLNAVSIGANTVTINVWGSESNMNANCGFKVNIYRTNGSGVNQSTILTATMISELTTSNAARNWTGTATSTSIAAGERIKVEVRITDVGGTMATGYTVTEYYDGTTPAASGDSYVTFQETITKQSFNTSSSRPAFTKGLTSATPSSRASYTKGATNVTPDSRASYLQGGSPSASSNRASYTKGQADTSGSLQGYTKGSADTSGSTAAYLKGQVNTEDNLAAYTSGSSITNSSRPSYMSGTGGGGSANSSCASFMLGIDNVIVPDGLIGNVGTWRNELDSETNIWTSIDETQANDSDYIWDTSPTNNNYIEFSLSNPGGVPGSGDVVIFWRGMNSSGLGLVQALVQLRQGGTVIGSSQQLLSSEPKTYYYQLTALERANITDWTDLRIRIYVAIA